MMTHDDMLPVVPDWQAALARQQARRWFLRDCGVGLAGIALQSLLARDTAAAELNVRSVIALFPTARRVALYAIAAQSAYQAGEHGVAVRLLNEALAITPNDPALREQLDSYRAGRP